MMQDDKVSVCVSTRIRCSKSSHINPDPADVDTILRIEESDHLVLQRDTTGEYDEFKVRLDERKKLKADSRSTTDEHVRQ